uniref:Ig-like domain-containing protein n=1 Tax=Sparus aurata TaxID=8175 RepID=A0A671Y0C7_SPAAU
SGFCRDKLSLICFLRVCWCACVSIMCLCECGGGEKETSVAAGNDLKLIVTFRKHTNPVFGPEFSASRLHLKVEKNINKLTILRTTEEDEGMYHCAVIDWTETFWNGTYLSLKGKYVISSDPVRPGDLKTLQCSVLSESETKTCPGDHSVFWFRVGSDKSHPNILYTDGNRRDECEDRSDTQKSCVHHFSKNISSSDAGTYYCAVATCGEILFGNGDKLEIGMILPELIALVMAIICLSHLSAAQVEGGDDLNYAALHLTGRKATRGRKKKELKTEESVYSQVRS